MREHQGKKIAPAHQPLALEVSAAELLVVPKARDKPPATLRKGRKKR
jgi:hypothetical protein